MMLAQINDAQLANWVITIALALLSVVFAGFCFLLIRMLGRMEKTLERHDTKIIEHDIELKVAKEVGNNNALIAEIYNKLDWLKATQ